MSTALTRNAELLKQNRDALFRRGVARLQNAPMKGAPASGTVLAGSKVFDPVTGEEGEVIHATRENVVVRSAE